MISFQTIPPQLKMNECDDHPLEPLKGCPKCWKIEKNLRAQTLCTSIAKNGKCTAGSFAYKHGPYEHQPFVRCKDASRCSMPWCGYIHSPLAGCNHIRPTLNCPTCTSHNSEKETNAMSILCDGNCKFNSNNECYFSHRQVEL
jgi:hypothetical protein